MSSRFEATGGETRYAGRMFSVRTGTFRHEDGEEVTRDFVEHPGAVAVLAHDGKQLYLVRQPREPVGEPDLLELPAGKLDVEGEAPLDTAKRELAEEIGKAAEHWEHVKTYYSSAGFSSEEVQIWLATGLSDASAQAEDDERIEIVTPPLTGIDELIPDVKDAKTLIGLLLLRDRMRSAAE